MKILPLLALMTLPCISYSCEEEKLLSWVVSASPERDAASALREGNAKFAAVRGFSYMAPGLGGRERDVLGAGNFFVLEGTSDDLCSENHANLNRAAFEYAKKYNKLLLDSLGDT